MCKVFDIQRAKQHELPQKYSRGPDVDTKHRRRVPFRVSMNVQSSCTTFVKVFILYLTAF